MNPAKAVTGDVNAPRALERDSVRAALHPGVVASDVWRRVPWPVRSTMKLFMITNEEGARTTLFCATAPRVSTQSTEQ